MDPESAVESNPQETIEMRNVFDQKIKRYLMLIYFLVLTGIAIAVIVSMILIWTESKTTPQVDFYIGLVTSIILTISLVFILYMPREEQTGKLVFFYIFSIMTGFIGYYILRVFSISVSSLISMALAHIVLLIALILLLFIPIGRKVFISTCLGVLVLISTAQILSLIFITKDEMSSYPVIVVFIPFALGLFTIFYSGIIIKHKNNGTDDLGLHATILLLLS